MSSISTVDDKSYLLQVARAAILDHLGKKRPGSLPERRDSVFLEKRGCFVTLHANGRLRGCIGTIEPLKPLITGIKENAVHAGFHDPRFSPVTLLEMDKISIEISILTRPVPMVFENADDLIKQLKPGIHGVILSQGFHRATFLPQVWEQLPRPEVFMEHLSQKAGLEKACWRDTKTAIEVYEVFAFSEKEIHPER